MEMRKRFFATLLAAALCAALFAGCGEKGAGPSGISKEEFNKARLGMNHYELLKIIGGNGDQIAEEEQNSVYTYTYKYPGEKGGYAIIVMRADMGESILNIPEVISKENHDLK